MSAGSIAATGSLLSVRAAASKSSRVGCSRSGRNSRYVGSLRIMSVATVVGWMLLTGILCGASPLASTFISITSPALAAE